MKIKLRNFHFLQLLIPLVTIIIATALNSVHMSEAIPQLQQFPLSCKFDTTMFGILQALLRREFQNVNINIVYDLSDDVDNLCSQVSVNFHEFISSTLYSSYTVTFYNSNQNQSPENLEENPTDKLIGHHTHQWTTWTELNVIILFDGLRATKYQSVENIVQLTHFQRSNSYTIFWQRENRDENMLQLPSLQRLLKFKIEIVTDDVVQQEEISAPTSSPSIEVSIKSLCFYCDYGLPEIQHVFNLQLILPLEKETSDMLELENHADFPTRNQLFQDYTKNFNGKMIRVALSKGIPTMMSYRILKNGRIETNGGFQTRLFHLVRRKLNFTYNITLQSTFGMEGPNATFTGMVGAVQTGSADLGIGAAVTQGRHKVVHYLTPNTFHDVTFITSNIRPVPEWKTIFLAFTVPLWFTIFLVATLLVYPTFVIANAFHSAELENISDLNSKKPKIITDYDEDENEGPKLYKILINGVSYIFRPVFDQPWVRTGPNKDPSLRFNSVQVLSIFWLVGVLILGTEFKSNLVRLSMSPPLQTLPTTFYQLAQADDFQILTHSSGGSLDRIVRTTHSPTFDKISQKMKVETSIAKCIRETLKGKTACISYEDDAIMEGRKLFSDQYGHAFIHRAQTAFNFFASIILPKEAVYIESMETTVSQIVDMGITKRYHEEQYTMAQIKGRRWAKKRKDPPSVYYDCDHPHFERLTMMYFIGTFCILLVGFAFAAISFAVESRKNDYVISLSEPSQSE